MQNLIKMNWKWNLQRNLSRVTFQNNMQRKINANAFTRCDNKSCIKRIKEICKVLPRLRILIQILSLPPKIKSFN